VTPYSAQVKHLTEMAQHILAPLRNGAAANMGPKQTAQMHELEIQSVDAFQGR
jgi:superfamily I DNA and/or RNA helicase